ncbi:MAG TPA: hypothetical protein VJ843_03885 [Candidatus Saccharimonadales bacterium]|nr:hypothetical protein [Candidatus Saccharimonadales bacterium]
MRPLVWILIGIVEVVGGNAAYRTGHHQLSIIFFGACFASFGIALHAIVRPPRQ